MSAYTTVLVGTDGSESSYRAVDRAAQVAKGAGATLLVVCAYRPMSAREVQDAAEALGGESYKVSGGAPAEQVLRDAADRARGAGAENIRTLAVEGDPVDELARVIKDEHVDLIVVGNRGLSAARRYLLGSVPGKVAHHAPCSVLIVRTG